MDILDIFLFLKWGAFSPFWKGNGEIGRQHLILARNGLIERISKLITLIEKKL